MEAAGPILAAAGAAVQGIAGYQAGKYNRKAALANQRNALNEGAEQALRIRRAGRIFLGRQIAAQAESGFEVGTGGALDSLRESQANIELQAMDAMRQGVARGVEFGNQADLARQQGKMALISGLFGAASGVASGISDYANAGKS